MTHRKNYKHQQSQKTKQAHFTDWYIDIPEESEKEQEETLRHPGENQNRKPDINLRRKKKNETNPIYCASRKKTASQDASRRRIRHPGGPKCATRKEANPITKKTRGRSEKRYRRTRTNKAKQAHLEINTSRQTTTETMSEDEDIARTNTSAEEEAHRSKKNPTRTSHRQTNG